LSSRIAAWIALAAAAVAQTGEMDPLLRWMDAIAQRQLAAREAEIAAIRTKADAEERKTVVRSRILAAIGGLPEYKGPLRAKVTGVIRADGYVIEKVLYESLPGFYVTANLYRPERAGKYPGVLLQAGHTQEGKAEPQLLAANLALQGYVSLSFDPAGQGEREQTYDPQLKAPAAGWSVNEHIHAGEQAKLVGEGLPRYFIWDAMRSLDYLASRLDVDASRIGAAGCSGGGALTTFIGALDERVKVVIPACFPNSYRLLFAGSNPHSEMTLPGHLAIGLDTADFTEMTAPKPWLLQATEKDYFTPEGARLVYEEARRWYELYGAADRVKLQVGSGGHGTPPESRAAVYEWLARWLKHGKGDTTERPVRIYSNHELLVTPTGRVDDLPGSRRLHEFIQDSYHAKRRPGTLPELTAELRRLGVPAGGAAPAVTVLEESRGAGYSRQKIRFESEPGMPIEGQLLIPDGAGRKPAVALVAGTLADFLAGRVAEKGRVVLVVEPRRSAVVDTRRPYVGDWLANTRADQIGISLAGRRAHDILRGLDLLRARDDVDGSPVRAAAQGVKGLWLLMAAAVDDRVGKMWIDRTPASLAGSLGNRLNTNLSDAAITGFVLRWDIEDLVTLADRRGLLWTDAANWMGRVEHRPGARFRWRWVLGDLTDMAERQDMEYLREWLE
jgi:cephalosporin-C deacetylase-like acetyl esterase